MLPGFRFLFAAIALSISTLVFGLGAAALLRASHERFASLPALPPAPALPAAATADASPHGIANDTAPPTLALLRVDPPEQDDTAASVEAAAPDHDAMTAAKAPPEATSPAPETSPATAPAGTETIAARPEPPGDQTPAVPAEAVQTVTAQAEPAHAAPISAAPISIEPTSAEPAQAQPAPVAIAAEPPAPLEPADAPIRTAMLAPAEPAPLADPDPSAVIIGPVPLPRSRESALAREHAAQRAAKKRRLVALRMRRPVRPPQQPAATRPASPFE